MTKISLVVAFDLSLAIAKEGKIPWMGKLPADMEHFKRLTLNHTVIMGRKTWESLPNSVRPLPQRRNIVLTGNSNFNPAGAEVAHSVEEALELCRNEDEIFVIGGAQIYNLFFDVADKIYATCVLHRFGGDTFFPLIDNQEWSLKVLKRTGKDAENHYNCTFVIFSKTPL